MTLPFIDLEGVYTDDARTTVRWQCNPKKYNVLMIQGSSRFKTFDWRFTDISWTPTSPASEWIRVARPEPNNYPSGYPYPTLTRHQIVLTFVDSLDVWDGDPTSGKVTADLGKTFGVQVSVNDDDLGDNEGYLIIEAKIV